MHFTSILAIAALASAAPMLKQRDPDVKTITTWEIDIVTSYTTLWVGLPAITAASSSSANTATPSSATAVPTQNTSPSAQPITALQSTESVINPLPQLTTTTPVSTPPASTTPVPATTPVGNVQTSATSAAAQASSVPKAGNDAVSQLQGATAQDGPCTPDQPCSGDITHYNPSQGVGACGPKDWVTGAIWTDEDMVVAVSYTIMGSESNGGSASSVNPLCNRSVFIKGQAGGKDMVAKVVDKCAGCTQNFALDLSPALFDIVAPNGDGRVHDVEWYWM